LHVSSFAAELRIRRSRSDHLTGSSSERAGDKVAVTLVLTRGRPRKLKATIEPEKG
jgi:hypothetical protein